MGSKGSHGGARQGSGSRESDSVLRGTLSG
jgi:hypothetical protein